MLGVPPAGLGQGAVRQRAVHHKSRGGTGLIAGQPISQADPFTVPGQSFVFSTTGVGRRSRRIVSVADDFTVPAGQRWDLDSVTLFAFQVSQTTPTVTSIRINLWSAAPESRRLTHLRPDRCHSRRSPRVGAAGGAGRVRRPSRIVEFNEHGAAGVCVHGAAGRACGSGVPDPETYWLEWSFEGWIFVVERIRSVGHAAEPGEQSLMRLFNALNSADTRDWSEGGRVRRGASDGRVRELPFVLGGT